jgi:hypothetical protein
LLVQRGEQELREPITTLGAAAAFVGVEPGAPADVYRPATSMEPGTTLHVDADAGSFLGEWYGFSASVLEQLRAEASPRDAPSRVQLRPEHFDLAFESGDESSRERAGYGASPGDDAHSEPYLYVVPWAGTSGDEIWNDPHFPGASLAYRNLLEAQDQRQAALRFLRACKRAVAKPR